MLVYVLFFIFLVLGGLLTRDRGRVFYLLILCFFFFLIIGLRDRTVGVDTLSYIDDYKSSSLLDYNGLIKELETSVEPLYTLITWLASRISSSYIGYLMIWALFPAIAIFLLLRRESNKSVDVVFAFISVFLLGLYSFFVAGIRQTAAISVVILSLKYLKYVHIRDIFHFYKDSNFIKFLICIAIAYALHNSAIIFFLIYFLKDIKVRWFYLFIPIGLYFISNTIQIEQITIFANFLFQDRFVQYGSDYYESSVNVSAFIMQSIIFLICFLKKKDLIEQDVSNTMLFNMAVLGLVFQSMSGMIAEMFRISFYFSIAYIILLPRALRIYANQRLGNMTYLLFALGAFVYLFFLSSSNLPDYKSVLF